jgi:hypothetical protein
MTFVFAAVSIDRCDGGYFRAFDVNLDICKNVLYLSLCAKFHGRGLQARCLRTARLMFVFVIWTRQVGLFMSRLV